MDRLIQELDDFCVKAQIEGISDESRQRFLQSATQVVSKILPNVFEGTPENNEVDDDTIRELVGGLYIRYGDVFWNTEEQNFSFKHRMAPPILAEQQCTQIMQILDQRLPIATFDNPAYVMQELPPNENDFDMIAEFIVHCTDGNILFEHNAPGLDRNEDVDSIIEKYVN